MNDAASISKQGRAVRSDRPLKPLALVVLVGISSLGMGCRSTPSGGHRVDKTLARHSDSARQAYAEGHIEAAAEEYRKAIRRAWAMDDPYESGTNAYNLAACMTSLDRVTEANDWLLDARVEFCRAGTSTGNTWLLSAKIAIEQSRFHDAQWLVDRAACSDPPCDGNSCRGLCGPADPCREKCITKIPCVGPKFERKETLKDCQREYQAQIHLTRARIAAEQYDMANACREFQRACELARQVCGYELQAELQNVAALIHIAKGEYLQAGWHLDSEAVNLRLAGNYREIPGALQLAAAAYEQAGLLELAADRLCRVARVLYGRGQTQRAWEVVQRATEMAEAVCSERAETRLALLANEILLALAEDGQPTPAASQPQEMLSSEDQACSQRQTPGDQVDLQAIIGDASLEHDRDVATTMEPWELLGDRL